MAALAYVLLPLSGLAAFFNGSSPRVRLHGLQAIVLGLLWPASLYLCSLVTPGATQVAFAIGLLVWLVLMGGAAAGHDVRLPFVGELFERAAGVRRS
jgi:uncharacterized membrane protein